MFPKNADLFPLHLQLIDAISRLPLPPAFHHISHEFNKCANVIANAVCISEEAALSI